MDDAVAVGESASRRMFESRTERVWGCRSGGRMGSGTGALTVGSAAPLGELRMAAML